jgi:Na+:H+ antiporter, NhaA family
VIAPRLPDPGELARYLRTETAGGVVLVVAAAVALIWANSPFAAGYEVVRDTVVGPAALHLDLTLAHGPPTACSHCSSTSSGSSSSGSS